MPTATATTETVGFRADRLKGKFEELGLTSVRQQAAHLGVAPSVISKLMRGKQEPSLWFLSRLRRLWPAHDTDYWLNYPSAAEPAKRKAA